MDQTITFHNENIGDIPNINCQLTTISGFNARIERLQSLGLSILLLNIRSMTQNFNRLQAFISNINFVFSLIVVTETWLTEEIDHTFDIPEYSKFAIYRNRHGGGISLYFFKNLNLDYLMTCPLSLIPWRF